VGASLAFAAGLDRYSRQNYILLNYHVHIPQPDPMVNPSTLERQRFYGVRSTPSYFIDGDSDGGGGGAYLAQSIYDGKVEPVVEKHLAEAPQAAIRLRATQSGPTVSVKASVSDVKSQSSKLRLQIALVEDMVSYSGENGNRFHEMVVRSLANGPPAPVVKPAVPAGSGADSPQGDESAAADAPAAGEKPASPPAQPTGFALRAGKNSSFEWKFDLAKVAADAKAHLEDFETNTRKGAYAFRQKKHEISTEDLSVVAFVQDEATRKVLQAVYVKLPGTRSAR
jgi:hypothetical protein